MILPNCFEWPPRSLQGGVPSPSPQTCRANAGWCPPDTDGHFDFTRCCQSLPKPVEPCMFLCGAIKVSAGFASRAPAVIKSPSPMLWVAPPLCTRLFGVAKHLVLASRATPAGRAKPNARWTPTRPLAGSNGAMLIAFARGRQSHVNEGNLGG